MYSLYKALDPMNKDRSFRAIFCVFLILILQVLIGRSIKRHHTITLDMLRMRRKIKKTWRIKEQNETRNVGFVGRHESYAHRSKQTHIERSSNNISDVLEHNVHQSSGRKIASKIVTPARDDQENNVIKKETEDYLVRYLFLLRRNSYT